jgi:DNA modification methylase
MAAGQPTKYNECHSVTELIPYVNNSRTHSDEQVAQVAASIKEFGFTNPILIDDDNGIIAGHGRLLAARKLGMDTIPTITLKGLTEAQKKAYVIADNQLALNAGWNLDALKLEIDTLQELDFDIEMLGFDDDFIDGLLDDGPIDGLTDEDDCPEPPEHPVSVLGDIWTLGNHRLMCGDSTSIDAVDKLMDGQKADMVFTDPPYGVSYEGGHNKKKREGIIADTLDGENLTGLFYGAITSAIASSKDGAAFYVWYASGKSIETFASLSDLPLELRAIIQWYKVKSGLGAFMSQYIPNCEPCMYLHKKGCAPAWYGPTTEKTVWELKKEPRNEYHPTQKPVELPERALSNSSKSGDSILDLFGGSGSTLIASEKTNRNAYLMEFDPKYVDVIINRWQDFTGKEAIHIESGKTYQELSSDKNQGDAA